jgi:hypothetical protein
MSNEALATVAHAIEWLFTAIASIGTISHVSYLWIDAMLIGFGMMIARPVGRAGGKMYSVARVGKQRLETAIRTRARIE